MRSVSAQTANWEFPGGISAAELARHRTADALMSWGFDQFRADAILAVSELVTNAILHGGSCLRLSLHCDGSRLWIGVGDGGDGVPAIREWNRDGTGGLGLRLIEAIAEQWYVEATDSGKTVWCALVSGPADELSGHHLVA